MRTPLQEVIERLVTFRDEAEGFSAEVEAYQRAIEMVEQKMSNEKYIIEHAYKDGYEDGVHKVLNDYDSSGNQLYCEYSDGSSLMYEYDSGGNKIYIGANYYNETFNTKEE